MLYFLKLQLQLNFLKVCYVHNENYNFVKYACFTTHVSTYRLRINLFSNKLFSSVVLLVRYY